MYREPFVLRFGGDYNILQPDIASRLRDRKVAQYCACQTDMIAAGNIGCMVQIAAHVSSCGAHIEPSHWATGGPGQD